MPTAPIVTDSDGKSWYVWDFRAKFAYPYDPDGPVFLLAAPPGGTGIANAPFIIKGDPGKNALLDDTIDLTVLEHDDPTADTAFFVETQPGTETESQLSRLHLVLHKGPPGNDGAAVLDPTDYGTPIAKKILQVNSGANGFEYTTQKVGGRHWPAACTEAGAGTTAGWTLATIGIPANTYAFDWQPACFGSALMTASGNSIQVDLVARLGSATGTVVARGYGKPGETLDRLTLVPAPDNGTSASTVTIAANAAATIYFRVEKQSGTDTYATGGQPSRFLLQVCPVP